MDSHREIRQMMAEGKYLEAKTQLDVMIAAAGDEFRTELLSMLLECYTVLHQQAPPPLIFDYLQQIISTSPQEATKLFEIIRDDAELNDRRAFQMLAMKMTEKKGNLLELHRLISRMQITSLERGRPVLDPEVTATIQKYFRHDYALKLQRLALTLALSRIDLAESLCRAILLGIHEKTMSKKTKTMLSGLKDVLNAPECTGMLILYRNYCQLALEGLSSRRDFKLLAELVIGFDDFEMQVMLLQIMDHHQLSESAQDLVEVIKGHSGYSFVYIDKHYPELKGYFVELRKAPQDTTKDLESPDLELNEALHSTQVSFTLPLIDEPEEAENKMIRLLKHQDYSFRELCDLAVSFLQSDLPTAADEASSLALKKSQSDEEFLGACYLRISSLMRLQDFRSALDHTWQALEKTQTQDDLLSMLYTQAECFVQLKRFSDARKILKRIIQLDPEYRLARERLEKLHES